MIFGEWSQFGSMLNAGRGVRSRLCRLISELFGSQSAEGNSPNGVQRTWSLWMRF
jgi:hypothetical protein